MNVKVLGYYNDELKSWQRKLDYQKDESEDLIRRISVFADTTKIDPGLCNGYIDQLMVTEQKFDYLTALITSQAVRLARTTLTVLTEIEYSFCEQQDALRSKMHATERHFTRTKYACSFFLFSFLKNPQVKSKKILA